MLDESMLKALAKEVATVAVMLNGGKFAVCISSKDETEEDVKRFIDFLMESLGYGRRSANHHMTEENEE